MKQFKLLAILATVAMVSCSNTYEAKTVDLQSENDSINYFLAYTTAANIRMQAFRDIDSTEHKAAIASFMNAFSEAIEAKEVAEPSEAEQFGNRIGVSVKNYEKDGLEGIHSWGINEPIFFQGIAYALEQDASVMDSETAMQYLQSQFQAAPRDEEAEAAKPVKGKLSLKLKGVELKSQNDSLNFAYGYFIGNNAHMYVLSQDSDGVAKKEFVDAINKAVKSSEKYPELAETGKNIGQQIKQQEAEGLVGIAGLETNYALLKQGFINGFNDYEEMSVMEMNEFVNNAINHIRYGAAIEEGEAFLAAKAEEEGVQKTESGLMYKVIKEGKGAHPAATDKVNVDYEGTLIDGTVFDSSYQRGEAIEFALNQVIKGWTEGVQLMAPGAIYEFYIPYYLGYGERGAGRDIPPYATLIFKIELHKVVK